MPDNTVVLRVELNEGKTEERLAQLASSLAKTRDEQKALTKAREQGLVSEERFGKESVKLTNQLLVQRTEQGRLTKDLQLYRDANEGVGTSYKNLQAQLSLAQRQYQLLDGSADNSSESAQALGKTIDELRNTLKATDETQSLFARNVGNYPKTGSETLEKLVQQLVALQEQQKRYVAGSQEELDARNKIGFVQQAAIQRGAVEGKSYEQTTNFLHSYGEAIRPATADLLNLAEQQQQVAQSGGEVTEEVKRIGFQMGVAKKSIKDATDALATVPAEADTAAGGVKGFGDTITNLDSVTGAFGGQVANLKQQFATAKQGIDIAKGGFTGLKGAIASTGIGVLILALGVLYEYFTKTDDGAEDLAAGLAYLKGLFSVLEGVAISAGKGLRLVFTDSLEAGKELVDFLENNLVNRVKSFGVLWEAIKNGDATKLADSAVQFATGITDATAKTKAFGAEASRAASAAYEISRAQDELDNLQRKNLVTLEENKNLIDKLVLSSKDRALTEQQRLANLDKASALEKANLQTSIDYARESLRIQQLQNAEAKKTGTIQDDQLQAEQEAQAELVRLAGQSASLQQGIQNRRSGLLQQEAADGKAAAAAALAAAQKAAEQRLQLRRDALALEALYLERQLKTVQANSEQELNILQLKLRNGYQAELNVKGLTVSAKKVIDTKYESESLALTLDFNRRKLIAALQAQADLTTAALAGQQAGSEEALKLQAQQIEQQRQLTLASLAANADTTAAAAKTNAQAAQQQRELEFQQVTKALTNDLYNRQRLVDNAYAAGLIKEAEYQEKKAALAQLGTDTQTRINALYRQDNSQNQRQADTNERDAIQRHTDQVKQAEEAKQEIREATVQSFQAGTELIISAFGEESAAGQAAVAIRKVLALVEIGINLQKTLSLNAVAAAGLSAIPVIGPALGTAYLTTKNTLAIVQAAVSAAAVVALKQGGIAQVDGGGIASGPSHRHGGIPLYHRGRPAGIEIEGGEPVLTAAVSRSPLLLSMVSSINQLAGGRALLPNFTMPRMALGGVAQPLVLDQMRGNAAAPIDYQRLGNVVAEALRKSPPVNVWKHFEQAQGAARFTDSHSST